MELERCEVPGGWVYVMPNGSGLYVPDPLAWSRGLAESLGHELNLAVKDLGAVDAVSDLAGCVALVAESIREHK